MIKLINVHKQFGDTFIIKGVNLTIPANKMTVIIGGSGQGKSVLLKQIAGLISPSRGAVIIDGHNIANLNRLQRSKVLQKFGYVFQFAALLDSLTVFENIGIQLLERGITKEKVLEIVKKKLKLVQLSEKILWHYPAQLSGGMRKRVGLARTLIANPSTIFYDEPTTGLDPVTTTVIHKLMYSLQQQLKTTSVVVSHDVTIFDYADKVALLHDGKINYYGDAKIVWQSNDPHIRTFIRGMPNT